MFKKLLIVIPIGILSMSVARAQLTFPDIIKIGIKAGVNGSFFTEDVGAFDIYSPRYNSSYKRFLRLSGVGGITVDYSPTPKLSIGVELLYNSRGTAYREKNDDVLIVNDDGEDVQAYNYYKYNIDYMELPVTLNYNVLSTSSKNWLKVYAGIAKGVAVHKAAMLDYPKSNVDDSEYKSDEKKDLPYVKTHITNIIGGLKVGGNHTKRPSAYGDLRGSYTLRPVFIRDQAVDGSNLNTRMFTFSATIGLQF